MRKWNYVRPENILFFIFWSYTAFLWFLFEKKDIFLGYNIFKHVFWECVHIFRSLKLFRKCGRFMNCVRGNKVYVLIQFVWYNFKMNFLCYILEFVLNKSFYWFYFEFQVWFLFILKYFVTCRTFVGYFIVMCRKFWKYCFKI